MKTFSALLALCAGNSRSSVNSPHKGQWRGALMLFLVCAWTNSWINNREAVDLRRHRAHYDVTVIFIQNITPHKGQWRGALMFPLICAWINGWANNREAGDLRRHRAHYDASVMTTPECTSFSVHINYLGVSWAILLKLDMLNPYSQQVYLLLTFLFTLSMEYHVCAPSQRETALQCNAVSHWLGTYTE